MKQFAAMDEKIIKIGDALMALNTSEVLDLQKYLESKGLVMQQAVVIAQEESKEEDSVKESANVNVRLSSSGSIIKLAKALMPRIGKTATEIKTLTMNLPAIVMENVPRETGKAFIADIMNELPEGEFAFELQDC